MKLPFHSVDAALNAVEAQLNPVEASINPVEASMYRVELRADRVSKVEKRVEDLTGRRLFAHKRDRSLRFLPRCFLGIEIFTAFEGVGDAREVCG